MKCTEKTKNKISFLTELYFYFLCVRIYAIFVFIRCKTYFILLYFCLFIARNRFVIVRAGSYVSLTIVCVFQINTSNSGQNARSVSSFWLCVLHCHRWNYFDECRKLCRAEHKCIGFSCTQSVIKGGTTRRGVNR